MVGLYFNTKNMSAILKALQNRKSVELKSEVIEFGVADDLQKMISTVVSELNTTQNIAEDTLNLDDITSTFVDKAKTMLAKIESDMEKAINKSFAAGNKQQDKAGKIEDKAYSLLKKTEDAADALGVKPENVKGYSELASGVDELEGWNIQIKVNQDKVDIPLFKLDIS